MMPKFLDGNKKENNDTIFYKDCLYLSFLFLCGQVFPQFMYPHAMKHFMLSVLSEKKEPQ